MAVGLIWIFPDCYAMHPFGAWEGARYIYTEYCSKDVLGFSRSIDLFRALTWDLSVRCIKAPDIRGFVYTWLRIFLSYEYTQIIGYFLSGYWGKGTGVEREVAGRRGS